MSKKDYSKMSFTEFNFAIDEDDNLSLVIDSDDWQIWRDIESNRYFYIETGINDASDFYEVVPLAKLDYSIIYDIQCDKETLINMFDSYDFSGEEVTNDKITYWWFIRA